MKKFPDQKHSVYKLGIKEIEAGTDTKVPSTTIVWAHSPSLADSVSYELTVPAAKAFRFNKQKPVTFRIGGVIRNDAIDCLVAADWILIMIKPDFADWPEGADGKATFHFVRVTGTAPVPDFDPTIRNGGGPRG